MPGPFQPMRRSSFVGISAEQEDAARESSEYNQREIERRQKILDAQRAQAYAMQMQQNDIEGKRTLAADQYGYSAALADQEAGNRYGLDQQKYLHDEELFEMHQAGVMAEENLRNLQAQKMAQFQADQNVESDYRQHDFAKETASTAFDYTKKRDEYLAAQKEKEAYLGQKLGQENAVFNEQFNIAQDERQHRNKIIEKQIEALHAKTALDGAMATEILRSRLKKGEVSEENKWKAEQADRVQQEKEDEDTAKGLEEGRYRLPKGIKEKLDANELAITKIVSDPWTSPEAQEKALEQVRQNNLKLRRLRIEIPFEDRGQSRDTVRKQLIQMLPKSEQDKPYQLNKEGTAVELPRGWKPSSSAEQPITAADREEFYMDHPKLAGMPIIRSKDGSLDIAPNASKFSQFTSQQQQSRELQKERLANSMEIAKLRVNAIAEKANRGEVLNADQWQDDHLQLTTEINKQREKIKEAVMTEGLTKPVKVPGWFGKENIEEVPLSPEEINQEVERRMQASGLKNDIGNSYEEYKRIRAGGGQTGQGSVPQGLPAGSKMLPDGRVMLQDGRIIKKKGS